MAAPQPEGSSVCAQKPPARLGLQCGRPGFGKIPWRRKWQPTPVLLPGKFHGQRSLVSYSPWGRKESDTTEQLHFTLLLKHSRHELTLQFLFLLCPDTSMAHTPAFFKSFFKYHLFNEASHRHPTKHSNLCDSIPSFLLITHHFLTYGIE